MEKTNFIRKRTLVVMLLVQSYAANAATLSGRLSFPSEEIPAMQIVARATTNGAMTLTQTKNGQQRYALKVPPGTYVIFAMPIGLGRLALAGAHTSYSVCARDLKKLHAGKCATGPLIEVTLGDLDGPKNIDIDDWYLTPAMAATLQASFAPEEEEDAEMAFAGYPAVSAIPAKPAAPNFASATPGIRSFKSSIAQGAAEGAKFAGHVAVARWSCGPRCENWALVDLRSGRIVMLDAPFQPLVNNFPCEVQPLDYRFESRALRVHRLEGQHVLTQHFLWSNEKGRLEPLSEGATPVAQFCKARPKLTALQPKK